MFKDVCTGEWAMNTAKQMAVAQGPVVAAHHSRGRRLWRMEPKQRGLRPELAIRAWPNGGAIVDNDEITWQVLLYKQNLLMGASKAIIAMRQLHQRRPCWFREIDCARPMNGRPQARERWERLSMAYMNSRLVLVLFDIDARCGNRSSPG